VKLKCNSYLLLRSVSMTVFVFSYTARTPEPELDGRTVAHPSFRIDTVSTIFVSQRPALWGRRSRNRRYFRRMVGHLRLSVFKSYCGWCFCLGRRQALRFLMVSRAALVVRTDRWRFLARTATPLRAGAPFARFPNSITPKRTTRYAACTRKCNARSAT